MPGLQEKCFSLGQKDLRAAEQFDNDLFLKYGLCISHHLSGSYTYKDELEHHLKIIQYFLQRCDSKNDIVQGIIEKLREGADECSSGFHDRVNSILLMLTRPVTLDAFLESIRTELVNSVAHQRSDEVHKHNTFFNHAHFAGFGVNPLNLSDVHSDQQLSSEEDIEALAMAINERYTVWSVLNDLLLNIEGELRAFHDYHGPKSEEDEGYSYGVYNAILTFFKRVLADNNLGYSDLFHYDENIVKLIDINWHTIQIKLWEKLKNEEYIFLTAEEERFYNKLLSKDEKNVQEDAELIQGLELYRYPYLIKYATKAQQQKMIPLIFGSIESTRDDESFFKALSCFNEFEEDLNKRTYFIHSKIKAWLGIADNESRLVNSPDAQLFLKFIQHLPPSSLDETILKQILSKENASSIIKSASKHCPKSIKSVLEQCSRLHGLAFTKKIFTLQDEYNNNILASAALSHPLALEPLVNYLVTLDDAAFIKQTLTDKNKAKRNFMMSTALCQPQVFEALLKIIKNWDEAIPQQILLEQDINGHNLLMLTLINRPKAFGVLLVLIANLDVEIQKQILTAKDDKGRNILMLAAENNPQAFDSLLKIIANLDEIKKETLTAKDSNGCNVLMLIVINYPQAFWPLLDLIASLDEASQTQILTDKNKDKVNFMMLLAEIHPQSLESLLKNHFHWFALQETDTKKQILSGHPPFERISSETKKQLRQEINSQWDNSNSEVFLEIKKFYKLPDALQKCIIMEELSKLSKPDLPSFQEEISKPGSLLNRALQGKEKKSFPCGFFNIQDSDKLSSSEVGVIENRFRS